MDKIKAEKIIAEKSEFISLTEASKLVRYTPEYLNSLSRKKRLRSKKIGRNWNTTREWLFEHVASDAGLKKRKNKKAEEFLKSFESGFDSGSAEKSARDVFPVRRENKTIKTFELEKENLAADDFLPEEKIKKTRPRTILKLTAAVVSIFVFYFGISFVKYYGWQNGDHQNFFDGEWHEIASVNEGGRVKGEDDKFSYRFSSAALASENFVIKEISFGGEMSVAAGGNEKIMPEIFDVRSESFLSKNKRDSQFIVSWKTNKLANNEIEYSRNGGADLKTLKQSGYGFSHGVVISKLEPGTPYVYKIKATDRWGNSVVSDSFAFYSGSKEISIFELISQELEKMFGWATK